MKVGYLITGRLKSTRLPKKLMLKLHGKPMIVHMLDRLKQCKRVDEIVICTSTHAQDDPLQAIAHEQGVGCFRGDPDDVIARLAAAAEAFDLDYILNITADCPFADPAYADRIVEAFEATDADLIRAFDLPHGAFSYGIKRSALDQVMQIKGDRDTEVWGRYFTDTDLFEVYDLPITNPLHVRPKLRMTLDYPEDFEFFRSVFDHLYREGEVFSLDAILTLLDAHPEIAAINHDCAKAFQRRFNAQAEISLKGRYSVQKAAVIGCGSIGQRHVRNLRALGIHEIAALRSRKGHYQQLPKELGITEFNDWDALLAWQPDVAIISNPSSLHLDVVHRLLDSVRGLLIEKPLAASSDGVAKLLREIDRHKVISFVGYNLQFHPAVKAMTRLLDDERLGVPLVFQGQVGQWLPDWHPYEDYRQAYYANKSLGGGAALTLIHEVHLAQTLLGSAVGVSAMVSPSSLLDLDVDVITDLMVRHRSGAVSQLHLDFIQRPLQRKGVISCERGWIAYDLVRNWVERQFDGDKEPVIEWDDDGFDGNTPYQEEMRLFLSYVQEGRMRHAFDAWQAADSLAMVEAAFASVQSGRMMEVKNHG